MNDTISIKELLILLSIAGIVSFAFGLIIGMCTNNTIDSDVQDKMRFLDKRINFLEEDYDDRNGHIYPCFDNYIDGNYYIKKEF